MGGGGVDIQSFYWSLAGMGWERDIQSFYWSLVGGGYKIFLLEYGRGGKGWGAVSGPDQNMVFTAQLRD